jgi:hypothetical protein
LDCMSFEVRMKIRMKMCVPPSDVFAVVPHKTRKAS